MGLLDTLAGNLQDNGQLTPAGQGLLAAGLGILAHNRGLTSGAQAVGMGGQEGLSTYNQARQVAMQQQLQNAQLQNLNFGLTKNNMLLGMAKHFMQNQQPGASGSAPPLTSPASQSSQLPTIPYGSGTGGISMQAPPQQPAMPPTQQPQIGTLAAPQGSPFGNMPGDLVAYGLLTDPAKVFEMAANQYAPTDLMKTLTAMGVQRNSQEWNQALRQNLTKANYIAPTALRGGGFMHGADGSLEQLPQVPEGYTAQKDMNGQWQIVPVQGGTNAIAGSAAAKARGPAMYKPQQVFNPATGQMEYTTAANIADRANGNNMQSPQPPLPLPLQARADYLASIKDPNLRQSFVNAVYSSFQGRPDADQYSQLWHQVVSGQQGAQGGAQGGGMAASAPLGAEAQANAQAKGQVSTMQDSYKALQSLRSGGPMATQDIGRMIDLASGKSPLVAGETAAKFAGLMSADAAEYEKSRDNLVTNLGNQLGMGTDAARSLVYGSVPAYGAPKQAILNGLKTLQGQVQMRMMKADYLSNAYNGGDPKAYNAADNAYDQHVTPELAGIAAMPAGPDRANVLKKEAANPQMRARLEWMAQNGILK